MIYKAKPSGSINVREKFFDESMNGRDLFYNTDFTFKVNPDFNELKNAKWLKMNRNTFGFKKNEAQSKVRGYDVYEDDRAYFISDTWSLVCHNDECTYVHGPHQYDSMAYIDKRDAEIVVFGKNVYDKINAKGISMPDFLASLDAILDK